MADQFSEAERSRAGGLADERRAREAPGIRQQDSERGWACLETLRCMRHPACKLTNKE